MTVTSSMLLNKRNLILPLLLLCPTLIPAAHSQDGNRDVAMSCPPSLETTESAVAPSGWVVGPARTSHILQRISIFQKSDSGKEVALAPDRSSRQGSIVQQTWSLPHDPSLKTYLRCRYRSTDATLVSELASGIKKCNFRFAADQHGMVISVSEVS